MFFPAILGAALLCAIVVGQDSAGNVAFTVAFKKDQVLDGGKVVVYTEVLTNVGSKYEYTTGVFTAPKLGLYVFHFYGRNIASNVFWLDLFKNDEYLLSAYGRNYNQTEQYASGGNSIVLTLSEDDTVYVRTRPERQAHLYGRPNDIHVTFSGYNIGQLITKS